MRDLNIKVAYNGPFNIQVHASGVTDDGSQSSFRMKVHNVKKVNHVLGAWALSHTISA